MGLHTAQATLEHGETLQACLVMMSCMADGAAPPATRTACSWRCLPRGSNGAGRPGV